MEEFDVNDRQDDIFSRAVRAGKRTYFFDVKSTRSNELFLTITESKKRFNQQTGNFYFEKHKLFLYQEDFQKFEEAFREAIQVVEKEQGAISPPRDYYTGEPGGESNPESSEERDYGSRTDPGQPSED